MKREEIVFAALAVGSCACCFAAGGLGAGLSRASSPGLLHLAFEAGFFAAASRSPAIFAVSLLIANTALIQLLVHLHGR